jgi:hypothetical protein
MRYIPLICQNTKAWNGLSQEDKDAQHWGMEIRALMHGGGEEG